MTELKDEGVSPRLLPPREMLLLGCMRDAWFDCGVRKQQALYNTWSHMKARCSNPDNKDWEGYGGRGIRVAPEWEDYDIFKLYVANLPNYRRPGYTLDRIDNDGNYEPGNVRWASPVRQRANQRSRGEPIPPFSRGVTSEDLDSYYGFRPSWAHRRFQRYGRVGSAVAGVEPIVQWRRATGRGGVLADHELLYGGFLSWSPCDKDLVGPMSVDLRLGPEVKVYRDPNVPVSVQAPVLVDLRRGPFTLRQGDFALAHTIETVHIYDSVVGFVCGKSSRAREGLQVEAAGLVDPGFRGQVVLELFAQRPITLRNQLKVCQLYASTLTGPPMNPYDSGRHHYQNQTGAQGSLTAEVA